LRQTERDDPGAVVTFAVVGTTLFPNTFTATHIRTTPVCFNVTFANPAVALAAPTAPSGSTVTGRQFGNIGTWCSGQHEPTVWQRACRESTTRLGKDAQARLFATRGTYTFTSTTNGARARWS